MKKNTRLVPFLLIGCFLLFNYRYPDVNFWLKMAIILILIIISFVIVFQRYRNNEISKTRILIGLGFIAVTLAITVYNMFFIEG